MSGVLATWLGLGASSLAPMQGAPSFELTAEPFADPIPPIGAPFTAAAADYDLDGDADLLINRHNLAPLELWRNDGGTFRFVERAASGLDEVLGIPTLYAADEEMLASIEAHGRDGLYLWHGPKRRGPWLFAFRRSEAGRALTLELRTNREIQAVKDVEPELCTQPDRETLDLAIGADVTVLDFKVRIYGASHRLDVHWHQDGGPPMFVGPELVEVERVDLWPPDPHGVAWVDVEGSERPELFIARGALAGTLRADETPKRNRYFVAQDEGRAFRLHGPERFPSDWGRARQPRWIDVDRDGSPELCLGNRTSPNALYRRDPETGRWVDEAAAAGLDVELGDVFAWLDVDDDGRDDLLYLAVNDRLAARRNVDGFLREPLSVERLGLVPAESRRKERAVPVGEYFETLALHVADFDSDGRLDLLLTGHRSPGTAHLFLRRGERFEDVTLAFGLGELADVRAAFSIDAENDGFEDVVCVRERDVVLLSNRSGTSFEVLPISSGWPREQFGTGCVLDANGDGLEDFVVVAGPRFFALNRTETDHRALLVDFEGRASAAVGAVVTAHYASGRRRAARFGSHRNPPASQTAEPLRFGVPAGDRIESLRVVRGTDVTTIRVESGARRVRVPR